MVQHLLTQDVDRSAWASNPVRCTQRIPTLLNPQDQHDKCMA